ncbi:MAG: hypothetical protein ACI4RV_02635 [Eubacteriales bacterium]
MNFNSYLHEFSIISQKQAVRGAKKGLFTDQAAAFSVTAPIGTESRFPNAFPPHKRGRETPHEPKKRLRGERACKMGRLLTF